MILAHLMVIIIPIIKTLQEAMLMIIINLHMEDCLMKHSIHQITYPKEKMMNILDLTKVTFSIMIVFIKPNLELSPITNHHNFILNHHLILTV